METPAPFLVSEVMLPKLGSFFILYKMVSASDHRPVSFAIDTTVTVVDASTT